MAVGSVSFCCGIEVGSIFGISVAMGDKTGVGETGASSGALPQEANIVKNIIEHKAFFLFIIRNHSFLKGLKRFRRYLITIMQQKQGKELHYIMEMVLFVDKPRKTFYFWG